MIDWFWLSNSFAFNHAIVGLLMLVLIGYQWGTSVRVSNENIDLTIKLNNIIAMIQDEKLDREIEMADLKVSMEVYVYDEIMKYDDRPKQSSAYTF